MRTILAFVALAFAVGLDGCAPVAPHTDRVVAGFASERATAGGPFAGFHLFGWVSPPVDSMSPARMDELAGAGFDLMLHAEVDPGRVADNRARLDLAAPRGIRCILWDERMRVFGVTDPASASGSAVLDSIAGTYGDHPAFFGYYLGDEPPRARFDLLAALHRGLRRRDPAHPGWNNLFGRGAFRTRRGWLRYTRDYVAEIEPAVLCNDHYDFTRHGDRGRFVENAAGLAAVARGAGIPFWGTVRVTAHGPYRELGAGEVRWQAAMLLAYGARGLGYFTYWTPEPDPKWNWQPAMIARDGTRTAWYDTVAALDRVARTVGGTLAGLTWLATEHAGWTPIGGTAFAPDGLVRAVEGRAALGHFADARRRNVLLVANSDSAAARTIVLRLDRPRIVARFDPVDGWIAESDSEETVRLPLQAGGFALLRFERPPAAIACGVAPNGAVMSATDGLRVALSGVGRSGGIEVLDAAGARLWARRLPEGESEADWDGGGDAAWIRIEDERGVTVVPAPRGDHR